MRYLLLSSIIIALLCISSCGLKTPLTLPQEKSVGTHAGFTVSQIAQFRQ